MASTKEAKEGVWTHDLFVSAFDDPATCVITYCIPCVQYGIDAERVHGGDCVNWGLKFWLYSCVCACGLVAGPTRKALRTHYKLPQQPEALATNEYGDCLLHTIPCTGCFARCQEANELKTRGVSNPINPVEFSWAPNIPPKVGAAAPTQAPTEQQMQ